MIRNMKKIILFSLFSLFFCTAVNLAGNFLPKLPTVQQLRHPIKNTKTFWNTWKQKPFKEKVVDATKLICLKTSLNVVEYGLFCFFAPKLATKHFGAIRKYSVKPLLNLATRSQKGLPQYFIGQKSDVHRCALWCDKLLEKAELNIQSYANNGGPQGFFKENIKPFIIYEPLDFGSFFDFENPTFINTDCYKEKIYEI